METNLTAVRLSERRKVEYKYVFTHSNLSFYFFFLFFSEEPLKRCVYTSSMQVVKVWNEAVQYITTLHKYPIISICCMIYMCVSQQCLVFCDTRVTQFLICFFIGLLSVYIQDYCPTIKIKIILFVLSYTTTYKRVEYILHSVHNNRFQTDTQN